MLLHQIREALQDTSVLDSIIFVSNPQFLSNLFYYRIRPSACVTANISCRVPQALGKRIDEAAEETQTFQSELIRRALRHYVQTNPDGLAALEDPRQSRRHTSQTTDKDRRQTTYDPMRDL